MSLWSFMPKSIRSTAKRVLRGDPQKAWEKSGYAVPAPVKVKWAVLHRHGTPGANWIETGTYQGETTAFLARRAQMVHSIEPEPTLAAQARERFRNHDNVAIIEALSEEALDGLMSSIDGCLSLWLDGHYSAGITYQGPQDTPIREELAAVERHLGRFPTITVLVDDVRCFDPSNPGYSQYPTRTWLVEWADRNGLTWTIEHDIFVATRRVAAS